MATIGVELRNEANTSTTATLAAFRVEFQKRRNADPGSGSFFMQKGAANAPTFDSLVSFTVTADDASTPAIRFPARVKDIDPVDVRVGDEVVEAVQYRCEGLLVDFADAVVLPAQAQLVPPQDERIFHWSSGEFQLGVQLGLLAGTWREAISIANQGWGSPFYRGEPAGWTDPFANYVWGDPTLSPAYDPALHSDPQTNAPPGRCLFWMTMDVDAGRKFIEWAADNFGILYVNGRRVQDGGDFRKRQQFDFETTDGLLNLAWDVTNAPDDGPVGGNPGGFIMSQRIGDPATGDITYSTPGRPLLGFPVYVMSYPSATPQLGVGFIFRQLKEGAGEAPAQRTDWTVPGTIFVDANGANYPTVDELSFRVYDDTLLDALRVLCQSWLDAKVDQTGKTLRLYGKGTASSAAPVTLVTGYSSVGQANPDLVNVLDLSWDYTAPLFTKLAVRWADGWVTVGSGDRWGSYRAEQLNSAAVATQVGNQLLSAYGVPRRSASITYLPLDEPSDLPLVAFDVGDTIDVPQGDGNSTWGDRVVQSVTYTGDDDGRVSAIVIEAGDPIIPALEAFEESIRRGAPGQLGGRVSGGSATSGKADYGHFDRYRVASPSVGSPTQIIASAPSPTSGLTSIAPASFVGRVIALRLIGQGSTGTSTVTVSDGATTWTLSGSANGLIDVESLAATNVVWKLGTQITVTIVTANHEALHVYADVADVR
jgi:hypothetical protein